MQKLLRSIMDGPVLDELRLALVEVISLLLEQFSAFFAHRQPLGSLYTLLFCLLIILASTFEGGTPSFKFARLNFEALDLAFLCLNLLLIHFHRIQQVIGSDLVV